MTKSTIIFIVCVLSFSNLFLNCKDTDSIHGILKNDLDIRKGEPAIFYLNNDAYSAESFRKYVEFNEYYLQKKTQIDYSKIESYLNIYIEETILLNHILKNLNLKSQESKRYLMSSISRSTISYFLDKESGAIDLIDKRKSIEVDRKTIERYLQDKGKSGGKDYENELESTIKVANSIKLQKLLENTSSKKKAIIGEIKKNNKVKIISKEIYSGSVK